VEFTQFVTLELTARPQRFPGMLEWTAPTFSVESSAPVNVGLDGEALELDPPLVFDSKPGALRVRLPRTAIGRSPTARAVHLLAHSTVAELAGMAFGHR
jgi:hypothetical protein